MISLFAEYNTLQSVKKEKEDKEKELESQLRIMMEGDKLIKLAKSYKIKTRKQLVLNIINQSLQIVFGENYKVDIVDDESKSSTKYNLKYKLVLYKNDKEVGVNQDLYTTTGGGIITVISILMKIVLGYINTGNKFFIFDEVFSQVSEKYRPGVARLLRILSDKYHFTFLIISHEKLEQEDIDISYEASLRYEDKIPTLNLVRNNKKEITYPYYEIEIENFQSIKKQNLLIKGVTVIHGDSDSGKSAIQRSISSIILNDFKPNQYPRWRKSRNKLTTSIIFKRYLTEDDFDFIELNYKTNVIYKTKQGEFVGKKLSESNISEILNSYGFGKINVDSITGSAELKNQIKRIYVTTQFDKLFLPEDRNGVEKILTILFDSQMFNQMISVINSDINSVNRNLKEVHEENINLEIRLVKSKLMLLKAILSNIKYYEDLSIHINNIKNRSEIISNLKTQYLALADIVEFINTSNKINDINVVMNKKKSKLKTTTELITVLNNINTISTYQNNKNKLDNMYDSITKLDRKLKIYSTLIDSLKIQSLITKYEQNVQDLYKIKTAMKNINIKDIITLMKYLKLNKIIDDYNSNIKNLSLINDTLNITKSKLELIHLIKQQLTIYNTCLKMDSKYSEINQINNRINDINDELSKYTVEKCSVCNGKGYIMKG